MKEALCSLCAWVLLAASLPVLADPSSPLPAAAGGLGAALRMALSHNPAVLGKRSEVEVQELALDGARFRRLPSVAMSGATADNDGDALRSTLRVQQPLWTFGKLSAGIEAASAGLSAERADLLLVQRNLMLEVGKAYAEIQGLHRMNRAVLTYAHSLQALVEHLRRRVEGSLGTEADLALGESRIQQARARLRRLDGDRKRAEARLLSLTVTPVSSEQPINEAFLETPDHEVLSRELIVGSPEFRKRLAQAAQAEAEAEVQSAALRPDLFFRAERNFADDPLRLPNGDIRFGIVLSSNLEGLGLVGRRGGQRAEAEAEAARQAIALERLNLQLRFEEALLELKELQDLLDHQGESVQALVGLVAAYERLYSAGRKSWLELLNIQREALEQRLELETLRSEEDALRLSVAIRAGAFDGFLDMKRPSEDDA